MCYPMTRVCFLALLSWGLFTSHIRVRHDYVATIPNIIHSARFLDGIDRVTAVCLDRHGLFNTNCSLIVPLAYSETYRKLRQDTAKLYT